jgi:hypothetical protein
VAQPLSGASNKLGESLAEVEALFNLFLRDTENVTGLADAPLGIGRRHIIARCIISPDRTIEKYKFSRK